MAITLVKIIGRREPLRVSDTGRGHRLAQAWNDADDEAKIEIEHDDGVWRGRWNEVKSIDRAREERPGSTVDLKKLEEEAFVEKRLAMTPEEKGSEVAKFNLWFGIHYGKKVGDKAPADLLAKLVTKQVAYYKKNPKAVDVPYTLFEEVMPKEVQRVEKKLGLKKMDDVLPKPKAAGEQVAEIAAEVFPGENVLSDREVAEKVDEVVL